MNNSVKLIVMGGSWGGLHAAISILSRLPANFEVPVILVLHRLKNFDSDLTNVIGKKLKLKVLEVEEKDKLKGGTVYIAPSNYHVLVENDLTFSLDVSENENYSRPSIDVTFMSAADIYGEDTLGILLSGASRDGSKGLLTIRNAGGVTLVQDPKEAEVGTMPQSAIDIIPDCTVLSLKKIGDFLISLK